MRRDKANSISFRFCLISDFLLLFSVFCFQYFQYFGFRFVFTFAALSLAISLPLLHLRACRRLWQGGRSWGKCATPCYRHVSWRIYFFCCFPRQRKIRNDTFASAWQWQQSPSARSPPPLYAHPFLPRSF